MDWGISDKWMKNIKNEGSITLNWETEELEWMIAEYWTEGWRNLGQVSVLFLSINRTVWQERGSAHQYSTISCLNIHCVWAVLGGLGEPLGS
jgi:hypothetical protein